MPTPRHIVLAGDSIFDNDSYVLGEPGVIAQLRKTIPASWSALKISVDGDRISDVPRQLENLPSHTTDLVVSVGGNDALGYSDLLNQVRAPTDLARLLKEPIAEFTEEYASLLDALVKLPPRLWVCSIYTAIPFDEPRWRQFAPAAIGVFNEAIRSEASKRGVPILRIDEVCTEADDFSAVSPIEPSCKGGQKIVDLIVDSLRA